MLEKIEAAYLAVMRVVVLIAATVALIVCIVGGVFAGPLLHRQLGFVGEEKLSPIGLSAFIAEQKIDQQLDSSSEPAAREVTVIPGKIAKSANIISDYLVSRSREHVDKEELYRILTERRDQFDFEYRDQYEDSLLAISTELKNSTGRPLSLRRVAQLLDWHGTQLEAEVAEKEAESMARDARASAGLLLAAGGLSAFILILFFFLFVKIERNLRIVRTREISST